MPRERRPDAQRCLVRPSPPATRIVSSRARCVAGRRLWSKAGTRRGSGRVDTVWDITRFALMKKDRNKSILTGHRPVPLLHGPQRSEGSFPFLPHPGGDRPGGTCRKRAPCSGHLSGVAGAAPSAHRPVVGAGALGCCSLAPDECDAAAQPWPPVGPPFPLGLSNLYEVSPPRRLSSSPSSPFSSLL